jgi:hypothetical protein
MFVEKEFLVFAYHPYIGFTLLFNNHTKSDIDEELDKIMMKFKN